jgi:hypothetical protein
LDQPFYRWTFGAQLALYAAAIGGYLVRDSRKKVRWLNVPYAFCLLNWAAVVGFLRFVNGRQQVTWETRAGRQTPGLIPRREALRRPMRAEQHHERRQLGANRRGARRAGARSAGPR